MRLTYALPLLACLASCANVTPSQQAQVVQALSVACNVDGTLVPIAQPVVASMGPSGAAAANMDSLLVHPAVVAACQAIKGTPASVTPVGASATVTPSASN
jgi:hypothetical protein